MVIEGGLVSRRVLVTGATSGIGGAVARTTASQGARVLATGRDRRALAELTEAAAEHGWWLRAHPAELTEPAQLAELAAAARSALGGVDTIVHAAGAYQRGPMAAAALTDLDRLFAVNVRAPYALTQALLADLVAAHGDVIFINSTQARWTSPAVGQYAATKHALAAVADSLRAEAGRDGIRVMTLMPGRTATPMQEKIFAEEGRRWRPETLIQPEDVAAVVVTALSLPPRVSVTDLTMVPSGIA
jgi:NADP-dependent 3-hydroxy acid dehydrogenase YdfG